MNRLFCFSACMLHTHKRRCARKEWTSKSMRHRLLLVTGFHGQLNSQKRPSVTFATLFPSRLRHAAWCATKWQLRHCSEGGAEPPIEETWLPKFPGANLWASAICAAVICK
jgi:hypothetical protein